MNKPAYERARAVAAETIKRIDMKDAMMDARPIVTSWLEPARFVKLHKDAQLPVFASTEAAGADLFAVQHDFIQPGDWALIPTGLGCAIYPGFELQVRPRSGLALRHGVTVLNAPGTIDSDYTGEIKVMLINHAKSGFQILPGDRIAQIVAKEVMTHVRFSWTEAARDTDRGAGGFGSTGV